MVRSSVEFELADCERDTFLKTWEYSAISLNWIRYNKSIQLEESILSVCDFEIFTQNSRNVRHLKSSDWKLFMERQRNFGDTMGANSNWIMKFSLPKKVNVWVEAHIQTFM